MYLSAIPTSASRERRQARPGVLLTTVSALALFMAVPAAVALPLGGAAPRAVVPPAAPAHQSESVKQTQRALQRASRAMQQMREAQAAARAAAQAAPSTVPHGLQPGGLVVAPGAVPGPTDGGAGLWQGAELPQQSIDANGRYKVKVEQTQQKAILTWETFNVSKNTDLYFDQKTHGGANAGNWIALNRVLDPSAAPSKILGSIKADGQVYVINRNGVVFGGSSQVNVNTLVASSLSLSNEQFMAGINNPRDIGFGNGGDGGANSYSMPQFGYLGQLRPEESYAIDDPNQAPRTPIGAPPGDVRVESGAQISMASGGKVMLFAPHVINSGDISAPDGQVIMAAGEQVYLRSSGVVEGTTNGKAVRGLDVAVSSAMPWVFTKAQLQGHTRFGEGVQNVVLPEMEARAEAVGYSVINNGIVQSARGNITITSRDIRQNGVLSVSTALNNRDGSVRLQAWGQGIPCWADCEGNTFIYWSSGTLTLAPGSVTVAMPDLTDTSEIEQSSLATRYRPGRIELRGKLIDIEAQANVIAPAGTISLVASTNPWSMEEPGMIAEQVRDGSRVYIGEDAYLGVAGLQEIAVAMERNFIQAELRINELRDSPLYRDSFLRGMKVIIDRRRSGQFEDGPMAGVNWVIKDGVYMPGEWVGTPLADVAAFIGVGKTDLAELSTKAGSILIKSSGSVITRKGSLLDVSGGSVRYSGGWNTETSLVDANGHVQRIGAADPGRLYTGIAGGFTRRSRWLEQPETWTSPLSKSTARWENGYLEGRDGGTIQFYAAEGVVLEGGYWGGVMADVRQAALGNLPKAGTLTFGGDGSNDVLWLLGNVVVSATPKLLPPNFDATTPLDSFWYSGSAGNDDSFRLRTTFFDSEVLSNAGFGEINLYLAANFTLEQGAVLDLTPGSSLLVEANTPPSYTQDYRIDGVIRAPGANVDLLLAENTFIGGTGAIDVSGQWVNELTDGVSAQLPVIIGGSVQLSTAQLSPGAVIDVSGGGWYRSGAGGGKLEVGDAGDIIIGRIDARELQYADLRAFSAGSGGSLRLTTDSSLQIGGGIPADPDTVRLSETLFAERGFRSVDITADEITVPAGTIVRQLPRSVDLNRVDVRGFVSGTALKYMAPLAVLPLWQRAEFAPASLKLTGSTMTLEAGSAIETDIGGTIRIDARNGMEIAGRLEAPGGKIDLSSQAGEINITDTGALLARGVPIVQPNLGWRSGYVLGGGAVTVRADILNFAQGSLVDVSGASIDIDVPRGRGKYTPLTLASDGGAIEVIGEGLTGGLIDGIWRGHAGGSGARGGRLVLKSGSIPLILSETSSAQSGLIVRPSVFQAGGFADLEHTGDQIHLEGVDLTLSGSIKVGGIVNGNGTSSRLAASYIQIAGGGGNTAAAGTLNIVASLIDVLGGQLRGYEQTVLQANDIRLPGLTNSQTSVFDVGGTLILKAGQIYPGSQVNATIKASDKIVVQQLGTAGPALSVGGILTLEAPVIEQGGTLKSPFGQIVLKASNTLTLKTDSTTSVSGAGLVLPYGNLMNGEDWILPNPSDSSKPIIMTALAEKRITLEGPTVELAEGSVVDIRGGGDLYAWEHVPGPGGSHDVLTRPGMYAIMPELGLVTSIGERIWLDGGNGLAADWYSLLPARYALLPGAYAIQMVAGTQGSTSPKSASLLDGSGLVSGYRSNAFDGRRDQQASAWRVMSGDTIRKYSEYNEALANTFFASEEYKLTQYRRTGQHVVTPRLPTDGGSVVFKAGQDLILNGHLRSQAAPGGRGGLVDIAAEKIAIVGQSQDAGTLRADGYLVVDATNLSGFGAGSLLIGGVRSGDAGGLKVDVTADNIVIDNDSGSALFGAEIILAASDKIDVAAGSVIRAQGEAPTGAGDLIMAPQQKEVINNNGTTWTTDDDFVQSPSRDWGALIRVSTGDVVRVRRENVDVTIGGEVTIGAGAVIDGGKALLIDATRNATVTQANLSGAALSLASGRIGFGGGSGLVLDTAALVALGNTQHLTLRSYSSIDIHSAVDLTGLNAVTFDAAAIVGYGSHAVTIAGNTLGLENTASNLVEPVGAGHGQLNLVASELVFGEGAKAFRGFDEVFLTGTTRMTTLGSGSLDAGNAAMTLSTPLLTGRGGAGQSLSTGGPLVVTRIGGAAPERNLDSLGTRWNLTGSSILFGGRADALGGAVELTASNGDVVLAEGAVIDVGGFGKQFFDTAEYTDAGRITLTAIDGSVLVHQHTLLDLSAHANGGGAGSLVVTSDGGDVVLNGTMKAQAAAGQRGGSFSLDIAALSDFSGFNQRLNTAGFSRSRDFRIRTGDVVVNGTTTSESFRLAADQGQVRITGTIDARARYGGEIAIFGGNGLVMESTAVLRAGATDTVDNLGSGRITLGITGGSLVVGGGLIDVGGGEGGKVTLRAPVIEQAGSDTVNVAFSGNIAGAREIVLEGFKRFDLADLASNPGYVGVTINSDGQAELDLAAKAAGKLNVLAEYGAGTLVEFVQDFDISAAYGNLNGLENHAKFHARPGMEINYSGDIVLKSHWNLGAGIVDEASAIAAGVMASIPALSGRTYVVAGMEDELLRDHTKMIYRTGGSILGETGVLRLRAEGDLILNGSISDGFFQYADPLDPTYLAVKGTRSGTVDVVFNGGRNNVSQVLTPYDAAATDLPRYYAGLTLIPGGARATPNLTTPPQINDVPYSAEANSPAAGTGNALAYATMFPTIGRPDGSKVAVSSWSQTLVAGAAPVGESADPARLAANATGKIVLSEQPAYNYIDSIASIVANGFIDTGTTFSPTGSPSGMQDPNGWLAALDAAAGSSGTVDRLTGDSSFALALGQSSGPAYSYVLGLWNEFAAGNGYTGDNQYRWYDTSDGTNLRLVTKFSTFSDFYTTKILPNLSAIAMLYSPVRPGATGGSVQPSTVVRTGTGDINIVARGDLQLKGGASIYTAGRRDLETFSDFTTASPSAVYAIGGGHMKVDVGGDIKVALPVDRSTMQHYTEWLNRQGAVNTSYVFTQQSSWWVDHNNFLRGVGALGGGNVEVSAGGDLDNLTVVLPTNGRVRGGRTAAEQKILEMRNGGAMTVEAGGAIKAGYYYIGRGAGSIEAGEFAVGRQVNITDRFGRTASYSIAPILSLGEATLTARTAGDLLLQTVLDPLLVAKGQTFTEGAFMSGHTERTALNLTSTGGDVRLVGQSTYLSKDLVLPTSGSVPYIGVNALAANFYPSKTRITALNGSVFNSTIVTMPGSNAELRILAGKDVSPGTILMARGLVTMVPSPFEPVVNASSANGVSSLVEVLANIVSPLGPSHGRHLYDLSNPARLPMADDYEPSRIYALTGSIIGSVHPTDMPSPPAFITTNEQTWFRAGTDIRNIYYDLRNIHPTDVSLVEAGNDIIGGGGGVQQPFIAGSKRFGGQISIQGPGALVLSAGRDVYGTELTLYSRGNRTYDASNRPIFGSEIIGLPEQGAAITVMAGLNGKQPSYDAFTAAYLDPANLATMPDYLKTTLADGTVVPLYLTDKTETRSGGEKIVRFGIVSFMKEMAGETLSPLEAWARFQTLPQLAKERFIRQVYMQELREAGTDQNEPGEGGLPRNGGYNRGYAAIEKLFPGKDWKGDVTIGNALFRTMSGGNIEVLTPGGGFQVAALTTDVRENFGLVTLGPGDINIFARNDVVVNRSRILTFAGGDEIIWSTLGDIDAGRGAKTVRVASAPEVVTDANGVTETLEKADISGSGIGTIVGFTGVQEGDVHLIAPEGTVNAGDAGVRVSGNLTLAARFVMNAANFDVGGKVKGLPPAEGISASLALEGSDSNTAAADAAKDATQNNAGQQPSIIIVEVLGFGGGDGDAPESEEERKRRTENQQGYDANSAVQFVGAGTLSHEQRQKLIRDGRL